MEKQTKLNYCSAPEIEKCKKGYGERMRIQEILGHSDHTTLLGQRITVCGWAKTVRRQKNDKLCFISLCDGSTIHTLQVVVEDSCSTFSEIIKTSVGTSYRFVGVIVKSPSSGQPIELLVSQPDDDCIVYGTVDAAKYPLSKKQHGREFLRELGHLRSRTYLITAVMRLRSQLAMAIHKFFQDRGFLYIHTPIITAADCEGAGEMFQVTTIMKNCSDVTIEEKEAPRTLAFDYKKEFFSREAFLTVSGQLTLETYCCGMGDVYTFGPTFRADKSHTSKHLAEFWMIEPELAFTGLPELMICAEDCLKYLISCALTKCKDEMAWFDANIEKGLIKRLSDICKNPFLKVSYTEAIDELKLANSQFKIPVEWGDDLSTEHERYLTEVVYQKPVIVYDYPKSFKAFYMRQNDDGKTVRAMDVLLPKIGEIIGGSQREERLKNLDKMIIEKGLDPQSYWWYRELRSFGTIPHSGFGLGFERLIMAISGVDNIRDVIPFPRYAAHAEF